ncbi:hypothetical protein SH668x_001361 [Planctomicrobium sp. SH668]|uniref:hypothetical protein n=1 Tax=Planctomicrobium sp. SH668 TaxID=3448126 RepID=UPI003F5C0828
MPKEKLIGLMFAIATAFFWGMYGPALGKSRVLGESPFKPYILIGLAYLLWGIVGGVIAVKMSGQSLSFKPEIARWGFIAGTLGAFGALTLTYAMFSAKDARLVMPVVFGGATAVSAIVGTLMSEHRHTPPAQIVGFILVILGVVLIQMNASHGPAPAKPAAAATDTASPQINQH